MTKTNDALRNSLSPILQKQWGAAWESAKQGKMLNRLIAEPIIEDAAVNQIMQLILQDRKRLIERLETEAVGENSPPDVPKRVGKDANGKYLYETVGYSLKNTIVNKTKAEIRQRFDTIKREEIG